MDEQRYGELLGRSESMKLWLRELYTAYGYRPYQMSKFEPYDLYAQNRSFVAGNSILTFTDTDGRLMALKPDVTLSIIKIYRSGQQKVCYHEQVYRDTGASREFREIPQAGLECIGQIDVYTQWEVLTLARESLKRISDTYILDAASVGLISGLLAATRANGETEQALLGYLRGKNAHNICALCEREGISPDLSAIWQELAQLYAPASRALPRLKDMCLNDEMRQAAEELDTLCRLTAQDGEVEIHLDFSIVNDLNYYNGLVFKGYVPGLPTGILSGGRYDNLVRKLGKQAGAIGFAVYLDLLEQLPAQSRGNDADVLLLYDDMTPPEQVMARAREMRRQGLRVRVQKESDQGRYGRVERMEGGKRA
ncbi:MAG: ATP phosphoribosyltransferase regulatory subunit [Clostridia bacterium]|nr:ATP phosphoribosyltransferase regulatory subunit [Clostridia bacterium]